MSAYSAALAESRAYYRLCDSAAHYGIPTSLDDPRSPRTVAELRQAVCTAQLHAAQVRAARFSS